MICYNTDNNGFSSMFKRLTKNFSICTAMEWKPGKNRLSFLGPPSVMPHLFLSFHKQKKKLSLKNKRKNNLLLQAIIYLLLKQSAKL